DKEQYFIIGNIEVLTPMLECKYKSINDKGNTLTINSTIADTTRLSPGEYVEYQITTTPAANTDQILEAGENAEITFTITNTGRITIDSIAAVLKTNHQGTTILNPTINIKNLGADHSVDITYNINLDKESTKTEKITFELSLQYYKYSSHIEHQITANAPTEDFEYDGEEPTTISVNSRRPWIVTTESPYSGNYCFESASISNQTNTYFKIDINNFTNDTITFYVKTSCEPYNASTDTYFDHLEFAIDGEVKQMWAGITPWTEVKIPISAGNHTLKWLYWKDGLGSENDDKAWVDKIIFPPCDYTNQNSIPVISAELPTWLTITDHKNGTATISGYAPNEYSFDNIAITAKHKNQTVQQNKYLVTGNNSGHEIPTGDFVSIYPTPATEYINIAINGSLKYNTLRVFDTKGKKMFEQDLKSNKTQMYLTNFKSGVYILELKGESGKMRRKIVVVK
ncbi:MAG: T9SS type A sorting domain-containing protein, partial [Bacteroidales bacterium]|nr:T9SS type A sorting domain-containing protein [Bacteroidales bacterium]